jgi:hypothetical protein
VNRRHRTLHRSIETHERPAFSPRYYLVRTFRSLCGIGIANELIGSARRSSQYGDSGETAPPLLTPLELLDRLVAPVPPLRIHHDCNFGVLARTAAHRKFPR